MEGNIAFQLLAMPMNLNTTGVRQNKINEEMISFALKDLVTNLPVRYILA